MDDSGRRILLIDDNPAIHQDFRKIFSPGLSSAAALSTSEAALFGVARKASARPVFKIDFALQGQLGIELVRRVETPAQLHVLGRHGCEVAQGFYFSRPLPADECRELLLGLAQRASFTDTLRLRIASSEPRPADLGDPKRRAGLAR